jgi:vancomycin resistance protein YoaR
VEKFRTEVVGKSLNLEIMAEEISRTLSFLAEEATESAEVSMVFKEIWPDVTVSDVNQLGVEELLGRGESTYRGSISQRKYNVSLGAKRINGVLVKPEEKFSFNENVGEVSALTGFKKAYVIRSGETVLDDGGGVCQVSTTVFRAALNAGLPILERKAHSYRVAYYEQNSKPGLDATVYSPSVDLEFLNDTPGYILVQTSIDESASKLIVEIYGTSDGRVVELSVPRVWNVVEPPDDLYIDDPILTPREIKQIEYKAWGAKAAFDWKVVRGSEVLQERTFYSSYRPWGAVYLRGAR